MTTRRFRLSYDYLCPFARNAVEHVIEAMRADADIEVAFVPFSLSQVHVHEGDPAVWDLPDPNAKSGILAHQVGLAVRERFPDRVLDAHLELFAARHDHGRDIKDAAVLRDAVSAAGVDPDEVMAVVATGEPLQALRKEHESAAAEDGTWGVPTFATDARAVFVRVMTRPEGDGERARHTVERILDLVEGFPELNEFKQTTIPR